MFRRRGEINIEALKCGRLAALRNAEELVHEAEILYENGAYPRSFFLSQSAAEELGKYVMMVSAVALILGGVMNWKSFWKRFRNHEDKLGMTIYLEYTRRSTLRPSKYFKNFPEEKKINAQMRMVALYSDFDGEEFYSPS